MHVKRISDVQSSLESQGVDLLLVSVGADLPYLTGYEASPSERLTVLVVSPGNDPVLFVPQLEAPRVVADGFEVRAWSETEDPVALAASVAPSPRRVAVGDHMWSTFLLRFQAHWPNAEFLPASDLTRDLRMRKDPEEVELLRTAARAADRVMDRIPGEVRFEGRSERAVARDIAGLVVDEGHDLAGFAIVGSGPNGASPHHEAGDRVIAGGDLVVCDFGGRLSGYHSDTTRTFVVGDPTARQVEVHSIVLEANRAGRRAVAPGVACQEVDRAARAVIDEAGFGEFFIHRTGHGIGLEVHEHPYVVEGNLTPLEEGMTFSVEPGIYLPGELGVRIEDIVACGPEGADTLNQSERDLVVVG